MAGQRGPGHRLCDHGCPSPAGSDLQCGTIHMDEGFRLMSRVEDVAPETVKIGMRVRFRVHRPEGEDPIPVFTPEGSA